MDLGATYARGDDEATGVENVKLEAEVGDGLGYSIGT